MWISVIIGWKDKELSWYVSYSQPRYIEIFDVTWYSEGKKLSSNGLKHKYVCLNKEVFLPAYLGISGRGSLEGPGGCMTSPASPLSI